MSTDKARQAERVTLIVLVLNFVIGVAKLAAGLTGGAYALVDDIRLRRATERRAHRAEDLPIRMPGPSHGAISQSVPEADEKSP